MKTSAFTLLHYRLNLSSSFMLGTLCLMQSGGAHHLTILIAH